MKQRVKIKYERAKNRYTALCAGLLLPIFFGCVDMGLGGERFIVRNASQRQVELVLLDRDTGKRVRSVTGGPGDVLLDELATKGS